VADLYTRLKELKKLRESRAPGDLSSRAATGGAAAGPIAGGGGFRDPSPGAEWHRVAPGVWEREEVHHLHGVIDSRIDPLIGPWAGMRPVMLDVETSGLSGGSGSTAFLIGLGVPLVDHPGTDGTALPPATGEDVSSGVRVTQLFLAEPAAEAVLLDRFAEVLGDPGDALYITYNGASFDLPVLRTRHILNRRLFPEGAHWDLLPLTRRLYAPVIGSCTLGRVERFVLGLHRAQDIPGSEVPGRYHRFIESGDPQVIEDVIAHHSYDVAHLGRLAWILNRIVAGGTDGLEVTEDRADGFALARYLMERGGTEALPRCARLLDGVISETAHRRNQVRQAARSLGGFPGRIAESRAGSDAAGPRRSPPATPPSRRWIICRRLRAVVARKAGELDREVELRRELLDVSGSREDLEEYAKVLEHRLRDYAGAIAVITEWAVARGIAVEAAPAPPRGTAENGPHRPGRGGFSQPSADDGPAATIDEALQRRLGRLKRRLARSGPTREHSEGTTLHTPPPSGSN
jgi:hypothetical protein